MQEKYSTDKQVLLAIKAFDLENQGLSAPDIERILEGISRTTLNRYLSKLTKEKAIIKRGSKKDIRYFLDSPPFKLSAQAKQNRKELFEYRESNQRAIGYNDSFHLDYAPGTSSMLGENLAKSLHERSASTKQGRQPAGTVLRFILKPLLIGMSWSSAKLEGNRYSVADTRKLFEDLEKMPPGTPLSPSAQMLLNHKRAIELIIDSAPFYGLNYALTSQIHKLLMQNLLADENAPGSIRHTMVFIEGTNYVPEQSPHLLEQNLRAILDKASLIENPIESAFFLWTNIAYLQPFEDGNKRTSRLVSNIPLLIQNNLPLSFIGVKSQDYNEAMLGIYEKNDLTIARELFEWAYRKSCEHYEALIEVTPKEVPVFKRFSEQIRLAVRDVIAYDVDPEESLGIQLSAIDPELINEQEKAELHELVDQALLTIDPMQSTYYGVGRDRIENWLLEKENDSCGRGRMK